MAFKKIISLDELHPAFLFFGLIFSVLVLFAFYQWVAQFYDWQWVEYIEIPSTTYRIICGICAGVILGLLYITDVFGFIERRSTGKKDYENTVSIIISAVSAAVVAWIAPAIIEVINFIMNVGYNAGLAILLTIITTLAFVFMMQILRWVSRFKNYKANKTGRL